jgi:hypothetical protein
VESKDLLKPVVNIFLSHGDKYTILNSAILELFSLIGQVCKKGWEGEVREGREEREEAEQMEEREEREEREEMEEMEEREEREERGRNKATRK